MAEPDLTTWAWLNTDVIARQAMLRPNSLAVQTLDADKRLTFAELHRETARVQGFLTARLPGRGARVALLARNSIHHVTLFYACARAGAVFQPLNWRLSGAELGGLLADAEPDIVIFESEFEDAAREALRQARPSTVLRIDPQRDELELAIRSTQPASATQIDPLAPFMLLYTSGTTGRPKGVIVTPKSAFFAAMNFTYVGELTAGHAQLCDVPLFHVVGLLAIVHPSLLAGAAIHLSDRFAPERTLARLADPVLRISHYFCVPQMAQALTEAGSWGATDLAGLRLFTGGAPMPAHLTERLLARGIVPSNGYGMSEGATIMHVPLDAGIARQKLGSVGVPSPAMEVRLVGKDGHDAPDGEVGEIWLRGPAITPGYWCQPEASAATFVDGWLRTGDAAVRDADGFYAIVDRWKDMYITGGENVYPAEVEQVLGTHVAVADAAVVGVPDTRWGETGCAFVVLREGAACDAGELLAWCEQRLARYKRPSHLRFVDSLPRTASGKLQKEVLRKRFAAGTEREATP